jgi:ATP-dependent DNA helicase RecQ
MLLTAHRAKGLEFDHVVVLDGGWDRVDKNEDRDAPRRLYYVAMTRARKTLTLARFNGAHALLDTLREGTSILHRARTLLPAPPPELARHYERLTLGDVDLSFAGRRVPGHAVHQAIAALNTGDTLRLQWKHEHWTLVDGNNNEVGRLARAYAQPAGMSCIAASVAAIVMWEREKSEPEYRDLARCERWEVVVPDLVFAPGPLTDDARSGRALVA